MVAPHSATCSGCGQAFMESDAIEMPSLCPSCKAEPILGIPFPVDLEGTPVWAIRVETVSKITTRKYYRGWHQLHGQHLPEVDVKFERLAWEREQSRKFVLSTRPQYELDYADLPEKPTTEIRTYQMKKPTTEE